MLDTWTKTPRCRRCRALLSETEESMGIEELCISCFAEHPPCLRCGGLGVVWRPARDSRGVRIRRLVACPACAA